MSKDQMARTIERIAIEELEITTLESRHNDEEDFHSLAVWEIESIMERAYEAGMDAAKKAN